ncbi:MAG TPA: PEP-CTERM system TPR-repeat protein PrsT [Sedimenticola sp.]|nr:PEP-CTERM system TPR-repeat protein PrsT [Sedimenticola sp.]
MILCKPYPNLIETCFLAAVLLLAPGPAPAQTASDKAAELYEKALVRFQKGETKTAIIHLKNAIQKDLGFLSAHVLLGKAYLRQGDGAGAEKEFLIARRLGADPALIAVPLAKAYLRQEKYKQLLDNIQTRGLGAGVRSELLVLRGEAYVRLNRPEEAEQAYAEAASLAPRSVGPVLGQASVLLRRGDFSGAGKEAARAIELAPKEAGAWYLAGSIRHAQHDLKGAISDYSRAIALAPDHLAARMARAGACMDLEDDARALEDILYLREKFPRDPRAAYLHAVILARSGDEAGSRRALLEAGSIIESLDEQVFSKHGPSLLLAGLVNYGLNQWEKARQHLSRYIELNPQQTGARKLLGAIMLSKGEYKKAIYTLEPALEFAPNDYRLLTLLGTAYVRAGRHLKATEILEKAMGLASGDRTASFQHALNRLAAGEDAAAMEELASVFSSGERTNRAGLILAVLHFKRREYDSAREVAEEIVRRDPGNLTVLNLLASIRMAQKDWAGARSGFDKIVAANPAYLPARINLAKLDLLEGKKGEAQRRLQAILKERPEHIRSMIELAKVAEAMDRPDEAIRWLEKARALNAEATPVISYLVDLYLRNGQAEAALEVARKAEQTAPEDLEILDAVGRSHMANNQPASARTVYRRMTRIASYDTAWLYRIARMQARLGDLDNAIWSLQKAVDSDADFLAARIMLVEAQLAAGRLKKAREDALALTAAYPEKAVGYQLLGDVRLQSGQPGKAVESYRLALEREQAPRSAIGLYQAYMVSGEETKAEAFLQDWVKSHPDDLDSKQALAERHLRRGRLDQARSLYEQILQRRQDLPSVLNNLANIYSKTKNPKALEYALRANRLAPDNAAINDTLGWLLVQNNQPAEGLRHLRNAHSRAAADPEIRYHIGAALERLGRREEARAELEQALAGRQPFDGQKEAEALLRQLAD